MIVRDFTQADAEAVNGVALAAFAQYEGIYDDWERLSRGVGTMAALAESGRILVAQDPSGTIVGAVAYVAPHAGPRAEFFAPEWPIIRMLVVDPAARGQGLGRRLTQACIDRALSDGAAAIALHTSPVMESALALYLRMGFRLERKVPDRFGVPYAVYLKDLRRAEDRPCGDGGARPSHTSH
jgi:ribosomal protein S18 acetylase RimI-like enzyme